MNSFVAIDNNTSRLLNGQLIDRELLENEIKKICHYVQHVVLAKKDNKSIVALIFPRTTLFVNPDYELTPEEGCFCPRNLNELGKCLSGCLHTLNLITKQGYAKLNAAIIINAELSVSDGTLISTEYVNEVNVLKKYQNHLLNLSDKKIPVKEEAITLNLIN